MPLNHQAAWLFLLSIPVACISWTLTHEEIFSELREYCLRQSRTAGNIVVRKFFYVFTCEYCFSHWIALLIVLIANYRLLLDGFGGTVLAIFAVVWIANQYMSVYGWIRLDMRKERVEIAAEEKKNIVKPPIVPPGSGRAG